MWQAYFRLATSLFLSTKKFISKKQTFLLTRTLERVPYIFGVVEADIFEQILKVTASAMRAL